MSMLAMVFHPRSFRADMRSRMLHCVQTSGTQLSMRISFPGKEQDDTLVGPGETRIGAAADNNIVVGGSGVAPHHLRLRLGERGIELVVLDAQARTHVNTRPVREKAILRLGDVISLGSVSIVLKPDRDAD